MLLPCSSLVILHTPQKDFHVRFYLSNHKCKILYTHFLQQGVYFFSICVFFFFLCIYFFLFTKRIYFFSFSFCLNISVGQREFPLSYVLNDAIVDVSDHKENDDESDKDFFSLLIFSYSSSALLIRCRRQRHVSANISRPQASKFLPTWIDF